MTDTALNLAIILGSNRDGRYGDRVAHWTAREAERHGGYAIDLIDVMTLDLPQHHPVGTTPAIDAYRARLSAADAFVVVTPEYNHSYPGGLKHAIDQAYAEWMAKPVAFVSYGGTAGGTRATEHLRAVFAEVHAATIRDHVSFHMVRRQFDANGHPLDRDNPRLAAKTMFDRLAWWAHALRAARQAQPYGER